VWFRSPRGWCGLRCGQDLDELHGNAWLIGSGELAGGCGLICGSGQVSESRMAAPASMVMRVAQSALCMVEITMPMWTKDREDPPLAYRETEMSRSADPPLQFGQNAGLPAVKLLANHHLGADVHGRPYDEAIAYCMEVLLECLLCTENPNIGFLGKAVGVGSSLHKVVPPSRCSQC